MKKKPQNVQSEALVRRLRGPAAAVRPKPFAAGRARAGRAHENVRERLNGLLDQLFADGGDENIRLAKAVLETLNLLVNPAEVETKGARRPKMGAGKRAAEAREQALELLNRFKEAASDAISAQLVKEGGKLKASPKVKTPTEEEKRRFEGEKNAVLYPNQRLYGNLDSVARLYK